MSVLTIWTTTLIFKCRFNDFVYCFYLPFTLLIPLIGYDICGYDLPMISAILTQISRKLPPWMRGIFALSDQAVIRWAIILGVLFYSALVIPKAIDHSRNYLILLGLVPALIGLLVLMRWPDLGLLAIIISGLVVPFSIGTGTQSSINLPIILVVMLLGLWIFQMIATREAGIDRVSRPFWPAIAIIVSTLISLGFGQFHWYPVPAASISAQLGGAMIFILSAGIFLLVAYHLQNLTFLRWMVWLFLAIAGIFMVGRIVTPIGQIVIPFYQRAVSDSMFWMWFGVLGYSQVAFNRKLHILWRAVIGLFLVAGIFVAFYLQRAWISGWLPMIAAIGFCTFIARPRYSIFFGLFLVVYLIFNINQAEGMVMVGDNPYSLMTRLEAWNIMGKIILKNPVFGVGPANYYWYTALYPILGYFVPFNSHNNYIDILSQTGLFGLGIFFWFCWEMGRLLWRSRSHVSEGFEKAFLYGCFGGLLGMMLSGMLGDWIFPFVYNIGLEGFRASVLTWLFLGGAVAIFRMVPSSSPSNKEAVD